MLNLKIVFLIKCYLFISTVIAINTTTHLINYLIMLLYVAFKQEELYKMYN